jgi:hypothetical protein
MRTLIWVALVAAALGGCRSEETSMDTTRLTEFASRYTAAWSSGAAASVAEFFAEDGSLQINDGAPAVGRAAITSTARNFMSTLPDLVLAMDEVVPREGGAIYRWTLDGTNTGPGGTGNAVHISGYEEWTFGPDGLIARSLGHMDEAEYQRQLAGSGQP